jgi:hypothetical protein
MVAPKNLGCIGIICKLVRCWNEDLVSPLPKHQVTKDRQKNQSTNDLSDHWKHDRRPKQALAEMIGKTVEVVGKKVFVQSKAEADQHVDTNQGEFNLLVHPSFSVDTVLLGTSGLFTGARMPLYWLITADVMGC